MKTRKNLALFVAICTVAALYSCKGGMDPAKLFVKKWQFDSFKSKAFDDRMAMMQKAADTAKDSAMKAQIAMQLKQMQSGVDNMKSMVLTCNADGTCEIASAGMGGQPKTMKAKWALSPNGKKMALTYEGNPKADTLNLSELTSERMTIAAPSGRGDTSYTSFKAVQ